MDLLLRPLIELDRHACIPLATNCIDRGTVGVDCLLEVLVCETHGWRVLVKKVVKPDVDVGAVVDLITSAQINVDHRIHGVQGVRMDSVVIAVVSFTAIPDLAEDIEVVDVVIKTQVESRLREQHFASQILHIAGATRDLMVGKEISTKCN